MLNPVKVSELVLRLTPVNVNSAMKENTVKSVNEPENFTIENIFHTSTSFFLPSCLLTDSLPEGILTGPNVCERDEMKEEVVRVTEQELVETTIKEWCWPKIRCEKKKMETMPVEKLQKMLKSRRVRYCCEGTAQNFMGKFDTAGLY